MRDKREPSGRQLKHNRETMERETSGRDLDNRGTMGNGETIETQWDTIGRQMGDKWRQVGDN